MKAVTIQTEITGLPQSTVEKKTPEHIYHVHWKKQASDKFDSANLNPINQL